jgi:hypothetical protein
MQMYFYETEYRPSDKMYVCMCVLCHLIATVSLSLLRIRPSGLFQFRTTSEIMNQHMVGLLGRVTSSLQGLYLHRTTQQRQTRINFHALSGIRTRDPVYERSRPAWPPDQHSHSWEHKNKTSYESRRQARYYTVRSLMNRNATVTSRLPAGTARHIAKR